ncbi:MAG: hypothetical protein A2096_17850 [Spirochaetes bacterium GWF1_41_5]|nr:MAG: hypothetical protein A2096_17850 [Spirochaetes bacterium GWF1_41_5]HBE01874.1 hypothetical protein [Spirochaetia bacterium]
MLCSKIKLLLNKYIDFEITAPEIQNLLKAHLARCSSCRKYYKSLRSLKNILAAYENISAGADLEKKILDQTINRKSQFSGQQMLFPHYHFFSGALAAVALIALLYSISLFKIEQSPIDEYLLGKAITENADLFNNDKKNIIASAFY